MEVFQGDAWSGGDSPPEDMLALYRVTCEARQCPPLAVCADDIRAVRGRIAELDRFKAGTINILVASDVAARGLDVKGVSHVFNFDTPWHPDDYVHRIGRTGRAGATGRAFTFVSDADAEAIDNVEKLTGMKIPVYEMAAEAKAERAPRAERAEAEPREERPRRERAPRKAREAAEERPVREERPAREERAPRRERAAQPPREDRAPRRDRRYDNEPPSAPGEWNGQVPGFLNVSAL